MKRSGLILLPLLLVLSTAGLFAQQASLPVPTEYVTDPAGLLDPTVKIELNHQLADFERQTSNQFLIVLFDATPNDVDLDQLAIQSLHDWHLGQAGKDNGILLMYSRQKHRAFIATGHGLEGALPDALCAQIIRNEIAPHTRQQDYNGGFQAGVNAIIAATKNEYQGTWHTTDDNQNSHPIVFFVIVAIVVLIMLYNFCRNQYYYITSGYYPVDSGGWGSGGNGGSSGGGDSFGGGGGGDSGGGGGGGDA